jgi:hypothetical protein
MTPRRLVFQLTSLLDLLLIVMFAQYLEMRVQEQELVESLAAQKQSFERELWQRSTEVSLSRQQTQRLMGIMTEIFRLNPDEMAKLVPVELGSPNAVPDKSRMTPREEQRLRDGLVRHLLTHDEMRKRIDLWQLHLDSTGVVSVNTGRGQPPTMIRVTSAEQVAEDLFTLSKAIDQPKSLVVMLLTWGDARFGQRQEMERGLELATERMQRDAGTRSRFEQATLGYRPDPSVPPAKP